MKNKQDVFRGFRERGYENMSAVGSGGHRCLDGRCSASVCRARERAREKALRPTRTYVLPMTARKQFNRAVGDCR